MYGWAYFSDNSTADVKKPWVCRGCAKTFPIDATLCPHFGDQPDGQGGARRRPLAHAVRHSLASPYRLARLTSTCESKAWTCKSFSFLVNGDSLSIWYYKTT